VLGKDEKSKQFNRSLKEDIGRIKEGLVGRVNLIDAGVVNTMEKARKAVNQESCFMNRVKPINCR
jgi:hypothetical protein